VGFIRPATLSVHTVIIAFLFSKKSQGGFLEKKNLYEKRLGNIECNFSNRFHMKPANIRDSGD
jgi:hypothetical protein